MSSSSSGVHCCAAGRIAGDIDEANDSAELLHTELGNESAGEGGGNRPPGEHRGLSEYWKPGAGDRHGSADNAARKEPVLDILYGS